MNKYTIEELDTMTELVNKIQINLIEESCSFDEACEIAKLISDKLASGEITLNSLKDCLPNLLEQVRL